jgi:ferredoxin-type protein NapF
MDMTPTWDLKATLTQSACLAHAGVMCQSCRDSCEVEAITFGFSAHNIAVPTINNDLCTGCGECERSCPEQAIKIDHH